MSSEKENQNSIQEVTTTFSFLWLAMANLVGVLLAALLLWPELNDLIAPQSYGRWIPLHMDWQLYGWCSLPLLGLLYWHFMNGMSNAGFWVSTGFMLWSIGMIVAGANWLAGGSTGKPFLNWGGLGGTVFFAALLSNWVVLALAWLRSIRPTPNTGLLWKSLTAKALVLLGLIGVPFVLLYTSDPSVYPPINPESGGATGHSLLASTLSLVFLMGLLPGACLRLKKVVNRRSGVLFWIFWVAYVISMVVYLRIDHGNASNRQWNQILGLGSLLIWPVLVLGYWDRFRWRAGSGMWRWSFLFWWGLLAVDGWYIFLPGILDKLKFTNALVAHSHLAMAGMVSALNMLILNEMGSSRRVGQAISNRTTFWLWNLGCFLYVVVMTLQGWHEGTDPNVLFRYDMYTNINYIVRLMAGALMLISSLNWVMLVLTTKEVRMVDPGISHETN